MFCSYSASEGLLCLNSEQKWRQCDDYKVKFTCTGQFCSGMWYNTTFIYFIIWGWALKYRFLSFLVVHRVQDALVWSWWPNRKRRLWGPQWPPERIPERNLPSANSHRGPDHLWGACLQHLRYFFKVRLTTTSLQNKSPEEGSGDSLVTFLSSLLQLWRHPWVCLCKCRSGEQELWRLQGQIYMSERVLWRYVSPFPLDWTYWSENDVLWMHSKLF